MTRVARRRKREKIPLSGIERESAIIPNPRPPPSREESAKLCQFTRNLPYIPSRFPSLHTRIIHART